MEDITEAVKFYCVHALTNGINPLAATNFNTRDQVSVAQWLAHLTAVWEDPGSNHAADSCVYRDSCCDIQSRARAVHLYCSA